MMFAHFARLQVEVGQLQAQWIDRFSPQKESPVDAELSPMQRIRPGFGWTEEGLDFLEPDSLRLSPDTVNPAAQLQLIAFRSE
jgi:hypothetical protein